MTLDILIRPKSLTLRCFLLKWEHINCTDDSQWPDWAKERLDAGEITMDAHGAPLLWINGEFSIGAGNYLALDSADNLRGITMTDMAETYELVL